MAGLGDGAGRVSDVLQFTVPGKPIGKRLKIGQFRDKKTGKLRPNLVTAKNAAVYIKLISEHARKAVELQGWDVPEDGIPLAVIFVAHFRWPTGTRKALLPTTPYYTGPPDEDNIRKSIYDGLMGPRISRGVHEWIATMDDSNIAVGRGTKLRTPGESRCDITLGRLDTEAGQQLKIQGVLF